MKELFAAEKDGKETSTTQAENLVATVNKIFKFCYFKVLICEIKTIVRRELNIKYKSNIKTFQD